MTELKVKIGKEELKAVLEEEKAPLTCEFFKKMLPIKNKIISYLSQRCSPDMQGEHLFVDSFFLC